MPKKSPDFAAVLAESVSFLDAQQSAGVAESTLALAATSNLWATVLSVVKMLGANFKAYVPQLKIAALAVYDEHIAPLDVPIIPNTVEPMFDGMLRGLIEKGFDSLIALPVTPLMGAADGCDCSMEDTSRLATTALGSAQDGIDELEDTLAA